MSPSRILLFVVLLLSSLAACLPALAQAPNQRLVLKDGTYQVVTKYQKVGDRVRYFSAERGQWEELPAEPGGLGGNRDLGQRPQAGRGASGCLAGRAGSCRNR